jgi:hypothetical protein
MPRAQMDASAFMPQGLQETYNSLSFKMRELHSGNAP